jgi:ACS family glucarate transporter-like MFS transporter
MLGYGLAALCYLTAALFTDNLWVFAGCLIMVGFTNDLIMAPSWACAQDIGRRYSATVSGAMNMVGNLGAALGNYVSGRILEAYTLPKVVDGKEQLVVEPTGYVVCFTLFALVYALGVVTWLFIDPTKPVDAPEPERGA